MVIEKVNLYGVNTSCPCGCVDSTFILTNREEAETLARGVVLPKSTSRKVRLVEFFECEDLEDGRYIYDDEIIRVGENRKNLEGDRILKFFNL